MISTWNAKTNCLVGSPSVSNSLRILVLFGSLVVILVRGFAQKGKVTLDWHQIRSYNDHAGPAVSPFVSVSVVGSPC